MFGTTRARIREALRALALIGLIETRPGTGSYVTEQHEIPGDTLELMFYQERQKFDELYTARAVIEPAIYLLAAEHITEEQLTTLQTILDECALVVANAGEPERFLQLVNRFDRIIGLATANSVVSKMMDVFVTIKEAGNMQMYRVQGAMENSLIQRRKVLNALVLRDKDALRRALDEHFRSAAAFYADPMHPRDETCTPSAK